ncbi:MAG: hypothetical protein KBD31_05155 [Proteobacteria bacterium]|nr:hypothetical protein [Pseudomonadota bacterium]
MSKISKTDHRQSEFFRNRLSSQLNPKHELLILMHQINWTSIEEKWGGYFDEAKARRKAKPARLDCPRKVGHDIMSLC